MKRIDASSPGKYEAAAAAAAECLEDGGVVLLPTDTAYALAADATNEAAVARVLELKGRHDGRPLSVAVGTREQAETLAHFSTEAARLWSAFMPGPLTLVLPLATDELADNLPLGNDTIGIRQPNHDLARMVAERFGRAYTATSANLTGEPPAFSPEEYLDQDNALPPDLIVDAGQLPLGPVSSVVSMTDKIEVIREGAIPEPQLRAALEQ